jgi:mitochondrial import inner membrane translocase subunit TIM8
MMGEMIGKLTSLCWDKCITSSKAPGSKFSSGETTCLTNCAQRYLDMSMLVAKRFEMQ